MLEVVATYNPAIGASSSGSVSAESRESKGFAKWLIAHLSPLELAMAARTGMLYWGRSVRSAPTKHRSPPNNASLPEMSSQSD